MRRLTLGCLLVALGGSAARAGTPIPSFDYLPTGNGFGLQVFERGKNAITQFLERPYRYLRPSPGNPDGEGVVRRNLVFDTYFGIRSGGTSVWLGKQTPSEVDYVDQSNVVRSRVDVGTLETESFFFAPFGLAANGFVMVLRVTNKGSSAQDVTAFSVHNFKLGTATNPDEPGANSEALAYDASPGQVRETGPGGGTMLYVPVGGADLSSCADGVWDAVQNGDAIATVASCAGTDKIDVLGKDLGAIAPGASKSFAVAVLFAADSDTTALRATWDGFLARRDGEKVLADALAEWESWRAPVPGLGAAERRVWRQSEAVLRMGQIREPYSESPKLKSEGMILASLAPGQWHSGWVRDMAYATVALARSGHFAEARLALDFFLGAEAGKYKSYVGDVDYRISTVRYFGDGEEEADFSGQPTRNIETDGWGLVLWAARTYVDASGDTAWLSATSRHGDSNYDALRNGVAEAIAANLEDSGMMAADASIWEVHWGNRQHFAYTTETAARGLCDMAGLARRQGSTDDRDRYQMLSAKAVAALKANFVDQNGVLAGSLERLAQGANYRDGATVEAFVWDLIPASDAIATATLGDFSHLTTAVGGFKRVEGSSDPYDTNEWILIDLRAAEAFRRIGQVDRASGLVDWVTAQAEVNHDLIPELYNTIAGAGTIGRYTGSIPMVGYGAGAYLITQLDRAGQSEHRDCGTVDPESYPDGGNIYTDGGPGGDGGGGGFTGRTGTACVCQTDGGALPGGELVLIGLVALVLVRARRRS